MRRNGRLFIILGVGLAVLAVALAFLMFSGANANKTVQQAPAQVKIMVAAQNVPAHAILNETMLQEQTIDRDLLKGGEVQVKTEVLGLAPKQGLVKGQRIVKSDLEVPGLTNDIEKGKRAVAVPVDRLNALAGMVRESDYVDVIFSIKVSLLYVLPSRPLELETSTAGDKDKATLPAVAPGDPSAYVYPGEAGSRFKMQSSEGKGDPLAKVIVQDVKVLRVASGTNPQAQQNQQAQNGQAAAAPADLVVLEVTDEQAEVMKFVLDNGGSFTFALRGKEDHDPSKTNGITFDMLVTNYQLPAPKSVRLPGEKQP
jgi:pilus assembly protein CpaB